MYISVYNDYNCLHYAPSVTTLKLVFQLFNFTCLYALNFMCDYFVVLDILWLLWDLLVKHISLV